MAVLLPAPRLAGAGGHSVSLRSRPRNILLPSGAHLGSLVRDQAGPKFGAADQRPWPGKAQLWEEAVGPMERLLSWLAVVEACCWHHALPLVPESVVTVRPYWSQQCQRCAQKLYLACSSIPY